jgi:serine/threonine protein kinase
VHGWSHPRKDLVENTASAATCSSFFQDTRLPEESIHDFARDLVKALQFLHSNGVVYCDLKPSNILLDENGRLKVCAWTKVVLVTLCFFGCLSLPNGRQVATSKPCTVTVVTKQLSWSLLLSFFMIVFPDHTPDPFLLRGLVADYPPISFFLLRSSPISLHSWGYERTKWGANAPRSHS